MEGWIRLHRKSLESRVFSDEKLWRLWTWCLLRANHATGYFDGETIGPGEFATATRTAAEALGTSPATVHRGLHRLADWQMVRLKVKRGCTIVTICNWRTYQNDGGDHETEMKRKRNGRETDVKRIEEQQEQQEQQENPPTPQTPGLPPVLDSPEFRSVLDKWRTYKGRAYKPRGLQSLISQAAKRAEQHGLAAVVNAFEIAMGNGHDGWNFDSNFRGDQRNGRSRDAGPGQRYAAGTVARQPTLGW